MSRTYRRLPRRYLRRMRGRRAALRRGDRSVPPDPWDDYLNSRESLRPWNHAWRLAARGFSEDEIYQRMRRTWHLPSEQARDVARTVKRRYR